MQAKNVRWVKSSLVVGFVAAATLACTAAPANDDENLEDPATQDSAEEGSSESVEQAVSFRDYFTRLCSSRGAKACFSGSRATCCPKSMSCTTCLRQY
jgi:hypothetical protein